MILFLGLFFFSFHLFVYLLFFGLPNCRFRCILWIHACREYSYQSCCYGFHQYFTSGIAYVIEKEEKQHQWYYSFGWDVHSLMIMKYNSHVYKCKDTYLNTYLYAIHIQINFMFKLMLWLVLTKKTNYKKCNEVQLFTKCRIHVLISKVLIYWTEPNLNHC